MHELKHSPLFCTHLDARLQQRFAGFASRGTCGESRRRGRRSPPTPSFFASGNRDASGPCTQTRSEERTLRKLGRLSNTQAALGKACSQYVIQCTRAHHNKKPAAHLDARCTRSPQDGYNDRYHQQMASRDRQRLFLLKVVPNGASAHLCTHKAGGEGKYIKYNIYRTLVLAAVHWEIFPVLAKPSHAHRSLASRILPTTLT